MNERLDALQSSMNNAISRLMVHDHDMTITKEICTMARREVAKLLDDDCFKKLRQRNEYLVDKNSKLVQIIDQKIEQSREELLYRLEQIQSF